MTKESTFYSNRFEIITRDSQEKAVTISTYTYAALKGIYGVPALATFYEQLHKDLIDAYGAWSSQVAQQKASTAVLNEYFATITPSINQWSLDIQRVYSKTQSEYLALFPKGFAPFTTGKQDMRINALNQLALSIGSDPLLTAVKTQVMDLYTTLEAKNIAQKQQKSITESKSQILEAARIAACEGLYYVRGSLMMIHKSNPSEITKYFRMDLLAPTKQKVFTGTTPPDSSHEIAKRKMEPTDKIQIKNLNGVDLSFYTSATKDGLVPPGTIPLVVPSQTTVTITASQLGDLNNHYLFVENNSSKEKGEWVVGF